MKTTIHKEILINAPREKVWDTMLNDATYRQWTASFCPGSYYQGSWDKGSKILFLGPNPETGKEGGMVSRIAENIPHEFVSIEHMGIVNEGVEDTESEEVAPWKGFHENYTFQDQDGATMLIIDTDMVDTMADEMSTLWDKALLALKDLVENN